jgi:four helix bundle protein
MTARRNGCLESWVHPAKARIRSHRDLIVWQRAMEVVRETYRLTQTIPKSEMYGLTAQMQRAAVSIAANIAEGHARGATRDFMRFLSIANGSLRELETYWEITAGLEYISREDLASSIGRGAEIGKMLARLREALGRSLRSDS